MVGDVISLTYISDMYGTKKLYCFMDSVIGTLVYSLCTIQDFLILFYVLSLLFSSTIYEESRETCIYIPSVKKYFSGLLTLKEKPGIQIFI